MTEVGLRGVLSLHTWDHSPADRPVPDAVRSAGTEAALAATRELMDTWDGKANGRVRIAGSVRTMTNASPTLLRSMLRLARERDTIVQLHAAVNDDHNRWVQEETLWRADGTIVYSDETQLIGKRFTLDDEQLSVLHSGATEGGLSDLRRRENKFETEEDGLLEVYTRIDSPEGEPLLFEAYYSVATVQAAGRRGADPVPADHRRRAGRGAAARLPLIGLLTLRLTRAARARERLMQRTDRLLRGRAPTDRPRPPRRGRPGAGRDGVRAVRAARGRTTYPNPCGTTCCAPARRCAAPAAAAVAAGGDPPARTERRGAGRGPGGPHRPGCRRGRQATVTVSGIEGARPGRDPGLAGGAGGDPQRGAARARRAPRGRGLRRRTHGGADWCVTTVSASTPTRDGAQGSYGLRGLQSLVEDGGGTVQVESVPGAGTTVKWWWTRQMTRRDSTAISAW